MRKQDNEYGSDAIFPFLTFFELFPSTCHDRLSGQVLMKEVQLTEDEYKLAKDKVRQRYEGWVLGGIKRTYEATKDGADDSSPLAAFILTSCAIDFLAGFYCGIASFTPKGNQLREFARGL